MPCKSKGCCSEEPVETKAPSQQELHSTNHHHHDGPTAAKDEHQHSSHHAHGHEKDLAHKHSINHKNDCQPQNGHEKEAEEDASSALCLAVVREDGADVVVFDASGTPRTFQYSKGDIRKLCFKSHGSSDADDLLTPCFDEDGNHGSPEEDCFCGVDTPHLHAHLYDPHTCQEDDEGACSKQKSENMIGFLASQILHPTKEEEEEDGKSKALLNIGVSERMPKECNSKQWSKSNSCDGSHDCSCGHNNSSEHSKSHLRRLHQVQHDDHVDYLVHNTKTGDLHLEHPSCNNCGADDVHGAFRAVGQRRLRRSGDGTDVQLHFFTVATRPFSFLNFLHSAFEPQSDRVTAATAPTTATRAIRNIACHSHSKSAAAAASPKKTVVSSTLICKGICCSSECPMIQKVLNPLPGVEKVLINVSLKRVIVKHDPQVVAATELAAALNKVHMDAQITRDGASADGVASTAAAKSQSGRSQFFVKEICCASEIPMVTSIVEPLPGVKSVTVNATTKMVYVDHDLSTLSASGIRDALNRERFGAEIRVDAATKASSSTSVFVHSTLTLQDNDLDPNTEQLTAFLKGFDVSQMESFVVNVPSSTIQVVHNPFAVTADKIARLLKDETGLEAAVTVDGADPHLWNFLDEVEGDGGIVEEDETLVYPKPTVVLSGVFWIVSMLHLVGENWDYLKFVGLLSVIFGLPPIAMKALRTLQRFQFDTNCLMLFASVGAVALQEFAEAAAVVFLFAISEWLEVRATARARRALSAIVQLRPDKANLVHPTTQELIAVPASAVPVGALVSVKTGDKIPCDGVVVEGRSTVDESSLTGESRPISKEPDAKVSGGTVNSGLCQLMVRTTSTSENSAVSRLIRLVEEAQANRSETEKLVDEFARWYTPVVVIAAFLMCSIPWAFGTDTGKEWTSNGLILIVVACPCALIISTPVSYVAGLAATAQRGILIKGGGTLEALGTVTNICFDKTGTLTNGDFAVLHLKTISESLSRKEVIQYLALMEERASHPVAQAILNAAKNEKVTLPHNMTLEKHRIIAGEGVEGVINGLSVYVGNERLFQRLDLLNALDSALVAEVESWKALGGTVGFMSIEGYAIVCAYCAADGVREESARVVGRLQKQGVSVTMLTGDNQDAALAIGSQIGLPPERVKSKLLPEEKLSFVADLSSVNETKSVLLNICGSKQVTLMCGDGVNDAPALAAANIGVAMGAGAALAMETSDVTLLDSNLEKLEYSILMGKKVICKIKENVVFSVSVKFIVLGFALAGRTHLWAAIASDVGAMILVTLNSMMLIPRKQKSLDALTLKGDIEESNDGRLGLQRRDSSSTTLDVVLENSIRDAKEKPFVSTKTNCCKKGSCGSKGAAKSEKSCCASKETVSGKKGCYTSKGAAKSGKTCCASKETCVSKKDCCAPKAGTTQEKKFCPPKEDDSYNEKKCCASKSSCCEKKSQLSKKESTDCGKGCCPPKETKTASTCKKGCCDSKK